MRPSRRSYAKKALVYNGPGQKEVEDRPKPEIAEPTDAIVKIVKTTICGTDLHILKGDVPTCTPGRILGHEGIGVVDKVGAAVTTFRAGDRVIVSCISSCGKCDYCRRGMYSHCAGILGTFSPCRILREAIRQRADLVAIFPDGVIDLALKHSSAKCRQTVVCPQPFRLAGACGFQLIYLYSNE